MRKIIILLFLFSACSKGGKDDETKNTEIKVVEPISSLAVKGATVSLFQCNYGCPFGAKVLFTGPTNDNGICSVPAEHYNDVTATMNVVKDKYWPFTIQRNTLVTLEPEGWLKLKIHATRTYTPGSKLLVVIKNELATKSDLTEYNVATDSTIMIRAYGAQKNKIEWQVVNSGFNLVSNGSLNDLQVPRFDTLRNSTLNY